MDLCQIFVWVFYFLCTIVFFLQVSICSCELWKSTCKWRTYVCWIIRLTKVFYVLLQLYPFPFWIINTHEMLCSSYKNSMDFNFKFFWNQKKQHNSNVSDSWRLAFCTVSNKIVFHMVQIYRNGCLTNIMSSKC